MAEPGPQPALVAAAQTPTSGASDSPPTLSSPREAREKEHALRETFHHLCLWGLYEF